MKRPFVLLLVMLAGSSLSQVPGPNDDNEGSLLTYDPVSRHYSFSWWGRQGRTYVIEQSSDFITWNVIPESPGVPLVETGSDAIIEWGLSFSSNSTTPRLFLRLRYTDNPSADPAQLDFDGDGVSDIAEFAAGTDLLTNPQLPGTSNAWPAGTGLDPATILGSTDEIIYTYDSIDRVTQITAPSTTPVGIILDSEGNITSVTH